MLSAIIVAIISFCLLFFAILKRERYKIIGSIFFTFIFTFIFSLLSITIMDKTDKETDVVDIIYKELIVENSFIGTYLFKRDVDGGISAFEKTSYGYSPLHLIKDGVYNQNKKTYFVIERELKVRDGFIFGWLHQKKIIRYKLIQE